MLRITHTRPSVDLSFSRFARTHTMSTVLRITDTRPVVELRVAVSDTVIKLEHCFKLLKRPYDMTVDSDTDSGVTLDDMDPHPMRHLMNVGNFHTLLEDYYG